MTTSSHNWRMILFISISIFSYVISLLDKQGITFPLWVGGLANIITVAEHSLYGNTTQSTNTFSSIEGAAILDTSAPLE